MIRKRAIVAGGLLVFVTGVVVVWLCSNASAPRFEAVGPGTKVGPYQVRSYLNSPRPFQNGRSWVYVQAPRNGWRILLVNLKGRRELGELKNANPEFTTADGTAVLCEQRSGPAWQKMKRFIERLSGKRIRFAGAGQDIERIWLVSLKGRSATRLGQLTQWPRAGTSFVPSPSLRYAYNKPTTSFQKPQFFVCDLQKQSLDRVAIAGWPQGWWDDQDILLKNPLNNFVLYNVATGKNTTLLSASRVSQFLARAGLKQATPAAANTFSVWNGKDYDFYLTDTQERWAAGESYLAKVERPDGNLRLIAPRFKFGWSDHLNASETYYVYSGRYSGQGSSAVFLRDLGSGAIRTLVPDDGARSFSSPNFYRNSVIYLRSNALWQIDLTGSNNVDLLPQR